jgi:hypothetical protein
MLSAEMKLEEYYIVVQRMYKISLLKIYGNHINCQSEKQALPLSSEVAYSSQT